jgi:sugar phosphate permease
VTDLLTTWYCRFELHTRMAVFYSASSVASAFSGLLAFAIQKMDGVGGLAGWRWIFILEGIATVLIGVVIPFMLTDSPATAPFLSVEEYRFLRDRLEQDAGTPQGRTTVTEKFRWEFLWSALREWKIWIAVVVYWGDSISSYGFTYSVPAIIRDLGYSSANAQLLTIPIHFVAACSTVGVAWWADKRKKRWPFIVGPFCVAMLGSVALLAIPHPRLPGLTYFFLFFLLAGVRPALMGILSWIGNNLAPSWKRAVGMALLISVGNLGGAIGSNIYLEKQTPHYWLGYGFSLGIIVAAMASTMVLKWAYDRENTARDILAESEIRRKYGQTDLLALGDKSPYYRYVT